MIKKIITSKRNQHRLVIETLKERCEFFKYKSERLEKENTLLKQDLEIKNSAIIRRDSTITKLEHEIENVKRDLAYQLNNY